MVLNEVCTLLHSKINNGHWCLQERNSAHVTACVAMKRDSTLLASYMSIDDRCLRIYLIVEEGSIMRLALVTTVALEPSKSVARINPPAIHTI